jgi:hypothetical protein
LRPASISSSSLIAGFSPSSSQSTVEMIQITNSPAVLEISETTTFNIDTILTRHRGDILIKTISLAPNWWMSIQVLSNADAKAH